MKLLLLLSCGVAAMLSAPTNTATDCESFGCRWNSDITFTTLSGGQWLEIGQPFSVTTTCSTTARDGACGCQDWLCQVVDPHCYVGVTYTFSYADGTSGPASLSANAVGCGARSRRAGGDIQDGGFTVRVELKAWCTACDGPCEAVHGGGH